MKTVKLKNSNKTPKLERGINSIKMGFRHHDKDLVLSAYQLIMRWSKEKLSSYIELALTDEESFRKYIPLCVIGEKHLNVIMTYLDEFGFEEAVKQFLYNQKPPRKNAKQLEYNKGVAKEDETKGTPVINWTSNYKGADEDVMWSYSNCPDYIKDKMHEDYVFDCSSKTGMFYSEIATTVKTQWVAYIDKQNDMCHKSNKITKSFIEYNDAYLSKVISVLDSRYKRSNKVIERIIKDIRRIDGIKVDPKDRDAIREFVTRIHAESLTKIEKVNEKINEVYPPTEIEKDKDGKVIDKTKYGASIDAAIRGWYNKIINGTFTMDVLLEFGKPFKNKYFDEYFNKERSTNTNISGELNRLIKKHCNNNNGGATFSYNVVWKWSPQNGYSIYGLELPYIYTKSELVINKNTQKYTNKKKAQTIFRVNNQNSFLMKYFFDKTFEAFDYLHSCGSIDRTQPFKIIRSQMDTLKKWEGFDVKEIFSISGIILTNSKKNKKPIVIVTDDNRRAENTRSRAEYMYDIVGVDLGVNKTAVVYPMRIDDDGKFKRFDNAEAIYIKYDEELSVELNKMERKKKNLSRKLAKIRRLKLKRNKGMEAAHEKICWSIANKREQFLKEVIKPMMKLAPLIVYGHYNSATMKGSAKGNSQQSGSSVRAKSVLTRKAAAAKSAFFESYIEKQFGKYSPFGKFLRLTEINEGYTSMTCPHCNHQDKTQRDGEEFHAKCCVGEVYDADAVGAYNILRKFFTYQYNLRKRNMESTIKSEREKLTRIQQTIPHFDFDNFTNRFPMQKQDKEETPKSVVIGNGNKDEIKGCETTNMMVV